MAITQEIERSLNLSQKDFVEHLCTDALNNASLAYRMSYPKCKSGIRQAARNLLIKTYIIKAIAVKKAELAKKTGFKVEDAHALYQYAYEKGDLKDHTGAMVSATTGIARLYGMDKDAGKPIVALINLISYAGAGGVKPPPKVDVKAIESDVVASEGLPGDDNAIDGTS